MIKGKPFVKWAGGKRQIIDKLKKYIPNEFDTYYEPFVGAGALLFELSPKKAVINDSNEELMNVYKVLCDETGKPILVSRAGFCFFDHNCILHNLSQPQTLSANILMRLYRLSLHFQNEQKHCLLFSKNTNHQ